MRPGIFVSHTREKLGRTSHSRALLYAAVAFSPFLDEGKERRLVAASCVFPRDAMLSSPPTFLICVLLQVRILSFRYITGACALWSERQYCDQVAYMHVYLD